MFHVDVNSGLLHIASIQDNLYNCINFPNVGIEVINITSISQGCKFSDFCLISENFTSKYLKMFFDIHLYKPF